jgi:Glycosyltransferase family 87
MQSRPVAAAGRAKRAVLATLAAFGFVIGVQVTLIHLQTDPLVDVRAYYDAGARLNAGLPLYEQSAGTDDPDFYRYPPLLAVAFRPLALLPFEAAGAIWEALVIGAFAVTLKRTGLGRGTLLAIGFLAFPIGWSLVIGQAQVPVTMLMAIGSPWALALATHLKLLPALAAVWWLGRGDRRSFGRFLVWLVGLTILQLVLEPRGSLAYPGFLSLEQVGGVRNWGFYAISPVAWMAFIVVGTLVALRLARTRYGWAAAVVLSVLATPRLLLYQLMTLLAGLRAPEATPAPDPADAAPAAAPARSVPA